MDVGFRTLIFSSSLCNLHKLSQYLVYLSFNLHNIFVLGVGGKGEEREGGSSEGGKVIKGGS